MSGTDGQTGAEIIVRALVDQGVEVIFGYPGGAVLPLYDALFQQNSLRHILVRHEQGAVHAAEGYARATGKPGVVLVTSGPGATNTITGLADAMLDSIPIVCLTGQVATHLIGSDAFQEADMVGISRPCTKHNWLVREVDDMARSIHQAFYIATAGRPGPVVVDLPKDLQLARSSVYVGAEQGRYKSYQPQVKAGIEGIREAVGLIAGARKPIFYTGGGVINSGPLAAQLLREFVQMTGYPVTSTLMGLGGYPGNDKQFLGMVGMHGTAEANYCMHDCDVMINVGARFDDRVTGRLEAFSPNSKKIHIDIDPSSINKTVPVDVPVIGDVAHVLEDMIKIWKSEVKRPDKDALAAWWRQIEEWRATDCLAFEQKGKLIKPQYAIQKLYEVTVGRDDVYITTEVGQHQMWAAQYFRFDHPNRLMTSGGLGTMGYGLPAAIGTQVAHPDALVIDISGEASVQMNIQELATAVQFNLPVKIFVVNNRYMGMVRQWQELQHGARYSESHSAVMPDLVKLADAYGCVGLRAEKPDQVEGVIAEMLKTDGPVIVDCVVDSTENCFPMMPSGGAHNELIFAPGETAGEVSEDAAALI